MSFIYVRFFSFFSTEINLEDVEWNIHHKASCRVKSSSTLVRLAGKKHHDAKEFEQRCRKKCDVFGACLQEQPAAGGKGSPLQT